MEDMTRSLLESEIESMFDDLSNLDAGSKEKSSAINDVVNLYKLKIEENKSNWEFDEKYEQRIMDDEHHQHDNELKEKQLRTQNMDRWINIGLQVGLTLVSIIAYDRWYRRGLKFEETGTISSPMTRNLLSKMLPKK